MGQRLFTDTISQLRYGTLLDELTSELNTLVTKCESTGKAGELVLKIKLKPGSGGQIEVSDDLVVKSPKEPRGTTIMFSTPEGNLTREDPRQLKIEGLRAVDTATGELKKVG
jgi:hypothetical protein